MPQIRGSATWMTNMAHDPPQPRESRINLDDSDVKAENNRMRERLDQNMECLNLQKHRRRADQDYEIALMRADVRRRERIQCLVGMDFVRDAMEVRSHAKSMRGYVGPPHEPQHHIARDRHKTQSAKGPSSRQNIGLPNNNSTEENRPRALSATSVRTTRDVDIYNKYSGRIDLSKLANRPKTAPLKLASQSRSEPAQGRLRRPKTSQGFHKPRPSESSLLAAEVQSLPGRSFAELKELTDIERISEEVKTSPRSELMHKRNLRHLKEGMELQQRIKEFYVGLDDFKNAYSAHPAQGCI